MTSLRGEWMPADWRVHPSGGGWLVETPGGAWWFADIGDVILFRDLTVTRSRSVDRDKARAAE